VKSVPAAGRPFRSKLYGTRMYAYNDATIDRDSETGDERVVMRNTHLAPPKTVCPSAAICSLCNKFEFRLLSVT
jgi:hypothetical protein